MLKYSLMAVFAMTALLGTGFVTAFSEGKAEGKAPDFKKVQEDFAKLHAPGKEHALIQSCAGEYAVEGKMWTEPGKDPVPVRGWATHKKLGSAFTQEDLVLNVAGQKLWATGFMGFDNESKMFQCTYVGGWSTTQRVMNGSFDPKANAIEYKCDYKCPITQMKITERVVTRKESETTMTLRIYRKAEGMDEMPGLELTYTKLQ